MATIKIQEKNYRDNNTANAPESFGSTYIS
jgi:hypothetical protein